MSEETRPSTPGLNAAIRREPDWPEGFYWNEAEGRPVYSPTCYCGASFYGVRCGWIGCDREPMSRRSWWKRWLHA